MSVKRRFTFDDALIRAAASTGGLSLACILMSPQQAIDWRYIASHPAVQGTVVSVDHVWMVKSSYTKLVISYQPYQTDPYRCEVSVRMSYSESAFAPGSSIRVVPRPIGCYKPILPDRFDRPVATLATALVSGLASAFLCYLWSRRQRTSRNATEPTSFSR